MKPVRFAGGMWLALIFSALGVVQAQPTLAELLDVEVTVGQATVRISDSYFTRAQLEAFAASTKDFLSQSSLLQPGEILSLQQKGLEGYVGLSAYAGPGEPVYLLTFFSEIPIPIENSSGVKVIAVLLSETAVGLERTAALE